MSVILNKIFFVVTHSLSKKQPNDDLLPVLVHLVPVIEN